MTKNISKLRTLVLMQLKEKWDLSFISDKVQTLRKVVFAVVKFAVITAFSYLALYLCSVLSIFSTLSKVPASVMTIILDFMLILSFVSILIDVTKSLYFSKDNLILSTYPVNGNNLFLSKIIVYSLTAFKNQFLFLIPIFFGYGILMYGFSLYLFIYFIWAIFIFGLLSFLLTLIASILSIPTSFVIGFLNKNRFIKSLLALVLLVLLTFFAFKLFSLIPKNINLIQTWIEVSKTLRNVMLWIMNNLKLTYPLTLCICGEQALFTIKLFTKYSYIVPLILIGSIIVLALLSYFVSKPIYLKMISKSFEFDNNLNINGKNRKTNKLLSISFYESLKLYRNQNILSSTIITLFVGSLLIYATNKVYDAFTVSSVGKIMILGFNMALILLVILPYNSNCSSIYSRDGESIIVLKTNPLNPVSNYLPRISFNVIVSFILSIVFIIVNSLFLRNSISETVCLFFIVFNLSSIVIVWSADIDFMHPETDLFKEEGQSGKSKNEASCLLIAFILAILVPALLYFLNTVGSTYTYLKLAIVTFVLLVLRIVLFARKLKVFSRGE